MKKVYVVIEPIKQLMPNQNYAEVIDVNILAIFTKKSDAEKLANTLMYAKIKETYMNE